MARLESFTKHAPAGDASAALSAEYMKSAKIDRAGLQQSSATSTDVTAPSLQLVSDTPATPKATATANPVGDAQFTQAAPASAAPDVASATPEIASATPVGATTAPSTDVPPAIQSALNTGTAIRFSSTAENQAASREPDFFLTADGQFVPNPKATKSTDGSINVELQNSQAQANKSLRDAITHESEMQRQAAKDMIRLFQKNNPGQPVPSWMQDLASAKPNLPDFVPFAPQANETPSAAPENGFVNRGVHGGDYRSGNTGGFAGNGGFDGAGMFRGNGSDGDGSLYAGAYDGKGQPMSQGETVKAKEIYDYMTSQYGLSPAVASGILGNMMTESSFKTNAYNHGEGAIGLCQWEGGRRTELEHFAAAHGKPVTDWHVQVDFMMHELHGREHGALEKLEQAQTPQQAAALFDKYFERSSGEARGQRMANAEHIFHQVATPPAMASTDTKPAAHNA